LGEDGHLLCVCRHERDIWHLIDDEGIGVGRCTFELEAPVGRQRICPCKGYLAGGGIQVGPSWLEQALDLLKWKMSSFGRTTEQQAALYEAAMRSGHRGRSHLQS
jgi:hypothetical protein